MPTARVDAATISSGTYGGVRKWYWCCVLSVPGGQPGVVRPCSAGDTPTWDGTLTAVKAHALGRHGVAL